MYVTIIKPWGQFKHGDVVDASTWRNRDALIASRHVRPAPAGAPKTKKA